MNDKDTLSEFHTGITTEGLSAEFSPVIRAFGTALQDWWRQRTDMEGVRVASRAQARTVLVQRVQAVVVLDQALTLRVMPDELQIRGAVLCRDVDGEYPLARHLYGLGIRSMTLEPGLDRVAFVRFLELCESEPVGSGLGDLLREAVPEHLQVEAEEVEPPEFIDEVPMLDLDYDDEYEVVEPVDVVEPEPEPEPPPEPEPTRHFESLDALDEMFQRVQDVSTDEHRETIVEELFDQLLQVAGRDDSLECDMVVDKVSELGNQLVVRGKLGTWVALLQSLHRSVVSQHSMAATRVCQEVLDRLGCTRQILCVLQQYDTENPPELSYVASYMSMVPATALTTVSRCDYWFQTPQLRRLLLRFLREAGSHHPEGMIELARDEDFGFAGLAVDVMPDLIPSVAVEVLKAALDHPDERIRSDGLDQAPCLPVESQVAALPRALVDHSSEVRQKAMRCLGECGTLEAAGLLIKVLQRSGFSSRSVDEKVTLYRSLAISGRPETLFKVEGALIPRAKTFLGKIRARMKGRKLDELRQHILDELVRIDRPQTREILRRAARVGDPALARAVKATQKD